jgi:hypothetical protein
MFTPDQERAAAELVRVCRPGGVAPGGRPAAAGVPLPVGRRVRAGLPAQLRPVHEAFKALDEPGRERLYEDLAVLAREHDRAPGPSLAMPSEYLEVVAIRG